MVCHFCAHRRRCLTSFVMPQGNQQVKQSKTPISAEEFYYVPSDPSRNIPSHAADYSVVSVEKRDQSSAKDMGMNATAIRRDRESDPAYVALLDLPLVTPLVADCASGDLVRYHRLDKKQISTSLSYFGIYN